jgi:hypothetical protein
MAQFGKQYVQTDLDADREVANTLADLIIGGLLTTGEIADHDDDADPEGRSTRRGTFTNPFTCTGQRPGSLFGIGPLPW